jgi:hypothetical protein
MRAAALASLSVVLAGIYLAVAAAFTFSPAAIGLGVLVIALVMAVVIAMDTGRAPQTAAVRS